MEISNRIVSILTKYGVSHAFGIPGGVVLKILYAMEENPYITPHLMLHEQSAGFAACGYAQASGKIGVAYATRGPGITNMITCIAEAYQESLPVLFITSHGNRIQGKTRFESNQELDIVTIVSSITKYAVQIDDANLACYEVEKACHMALEGRKGPVLIDLLSSIYDKRVSPDTRRYEPEKRIESDCIDALTEIRKSISEAQRPIVLIGDGIRNVVSDKTLRDFISNIEIPILSSRGSQDILMQSEYYYGYIGSHGMRYSNFILSKADLIITLGNRLAFPLKSKSYAPILDRAKIIRIDVDAKEFTRSIKNAENYEVDARDLIDCIVDRKIVISTERDWIEVCSRLKDELQSYDKPLPVQQLIDFIKKQNGENVYVSDVGNNEFYVSRAIEAVHPKGMLLCSKAYGTLGVALARAIGAYYATEKNVICIMGDQGFQYNVQDLNYISRHRLPIKVIVLNNKSSGMIADHEHKLFSEKLVHVNEECDYFPANIEAVAKAYDFVYTDDPAIACNDESINLIYEIKYSRDIALAPNLPVGNACQNMEPLIEKSKYKLLDNI